MTTQSVPTRTHPLPRTGWLRRGYSMHQVDAAVRAVESALAQDPPTVTARDIRRLGFSLRHHGYRIAAVDALLDELEQRCTDASLRSVPPWQVADEAARDLGLLLESSGTGAGERFPRTRWFQRGYDPAQVDALFERCVRELAAFSSNSWADAPAGALGADEVRATVFGRRRHGYREEAVDLAFDEVVELLLRRATLARAAGGR